MVLSSFGCAICLVAGIEKKAAMASQKYLLYFSSAHQAELFSKNVLYKFSFTNCYSYGFMLIFLKLGFFSNAVEYRY